MQDTLLAMARGIREFRGASSLSTWLYTIARSFCIKARRRSKFAPDPARSLETEMLPDDNRLVDPALRPDEVVAGNEVEQALERAILELEVPYREVLVLRDIEGLTAPEVAQVLGITSVAVKSRLHRARLAVRRHMAPLLGIPTDRTASPAACPDVLRLFSQHLEDEISAEVCAQMEQHVSACERCRGLCDSLQRTLALCRTAPGPRIPAGVQESVRAAVRDLLAAPPASPGGR